MVSQNTFLMPVKRKKRWVIFFLVIFFLSWFLYGENNSIVVTSLELKFDRLPQEFKGFKILLLSDLHNKRFGPRQQILLQHIKEANPDLIAITGDLVDSRKYDPEPCYELVKGLTPLAPVFYVTGNHEWASGKYASLAKGLKERGVRVLSNSKIYLEREGIRLAIVGLEDAAKNPGLSSDHIYNRELARLAKEVTKAPFQILLVHRPEKLKLYAQYGPDLILAGHAHGGQVRVPFVGGLVAPGQGLWPSYTAGVHREKNSILVISRGLGNSMIPQRLFNRPELVLITLER